MPAPKLEALLPREYQSIDPLKQLQWEQKLLRGDDVEQIDRSLIGEMSKDEVQAALFYFQPHNKLFMVHLEKDRPRIRF